MNKIIQFFRELFMKTAPQPIPIPTPNPIQQPTPTQPSAPPITTGRLNRWIDAIKVMEGAKLERNNPGNLRYVGQAHAFNDNGFCKSYRNSNINIWFDT